MRRCRRPQPIAPAIAREAVHRLEAAALGHNSELFARELERVARHLARAGAPPATRTNPASRSSSRRSRSACRRSVLQRILLCLNPAISQSVQRVYELALLHEEIEPDAALRLVAIWQASHPAEQEIAGAGRAPLISRNTCTTTRASARAGTLPVVAAQGPLGRVTPRSRKARQRAEASDSLYGHHTYRENCARRDPRPRRSRCRDRT